MIKAVIFDLDGTIGDTLPLCIRAFRDSIEKLSGVILKDEEIIAKFGPSEEGVIKALLKDEYEKGIKEYLINYEKFHYMSPNAFEGITEILDYIKGKKIIVGIVTGKGKNSAKITLDKYDIKEYFDVIETGSDKGPIKRDGLRNIMLKYKLKPQEVIYVGDSVSDMYDAKALNIKAYGAAWAESANYSELEKSGADEIFTSIKNFKEHIENLL